VVTAKRLVMVDATGMSADTLFATCSTVLTSEP